MSDEANDLQALQALFDEQTLTIAGEQVTVRELTFAQGLRATAAARPIVERLRADGEADRAPDVLALVEEHPESWITLLAIATDHDPAWVEGLRDDEGLALAMAFLTVNRGFFVRRLRVLMAAAQPANEPSAPSTCSAGSPRPATGPAPEPSPSVTPGG